MIDKVVRFLEQRGWDYQKVSDQEVSTSFSVEVEGQTLGFPLFIMAITDSFNREFLRLTSVPFTEQPYAGYSEQFLLMIAQINHDLPLLRFAIDADGDLELLLDFPVEILSQQQFDQGLQILVDYAVVHYPEILNAVSAG
jgi:hypothetical protein